MISNRLFRGHCLLNSCDSSCHSAPPDRLPRYRHQGGRFCEQIAVAVLAVGSASYPPVTSSCGRHVDRLLDLGTSGPVRLVGWRPLSDRFAVNAFFGVADDMDAAFLFQQQAKAPPDLRDARLYNNHTAISGKLKTCPCFVCVDSWTCNDNSREKLHSSHIVQLRSVFGWR